jgi:hypothetical protein
MIDTKISAKALDMLYATSPHLQMVRISSQKLEEPEFAAVKNRYRSTIKIDGNSKRSALF